MDELYYVPLLENFWLLKQCFILVNFYLYLVLKNPPAMYFYLFDKGLIHLVASYRATFWLDYRQYSSYEF